MSLFKYQSKYLLGGVLFFLFGLLILSAFRLAFLDYYVSSDMEVSHSEIFRALLMGIRLDAKWLSLFLIPSWLVLIFSIFTGKLAKVSLFLATVALLVIITLDSINFGFYGFYKSPINPLIFGFFQDDTKAILKTLWSDWPVITYVLVIALATGIPVVCTVWFTKKSTLRLRKKSIVVLVVLLTITQACLIRGSLGKFPLRQEDLAVSKNPVVNYTITNGCQALYESFKSMKALRIEGDPLTPIKEFGFTSEDDAIKMIGNDPQKNLPTPVNFSNKPNVVFAVMESMSADVFKSHDPIHNNVLGKLEKEIEHGIVFENCVSVQNGTFPSLEGLIFNTPLSPLSQSKYGRRKLEFSQVLAFKKAGYETIFLTGAPESWRQISETFGKYGFDKVYGSATISEAFPMAEIGPWGIGDRWLFELAQSIIKEAEQRKRPVFLMILSTTNHPPFKIPDQDEAQLLPVNPDYLPKIINKDSPSRKEVVTMLQTYQYAANSLGNFVESLNEHGWLNNTIVVATGDHNARFNYKLDGNWHRVFGVPLIFWLPDSKNYDALDRTMWTSHRDVFPTLLYLALGKSSSMEKGRNLFSGKIPDGALSYIDIFGSQGFIIGKPGMAIVRKQTVNGQTGCFKWNKQYQLVPVECDLELESLLNSGRAQRALSEVAVRRGVLLNHPAKSED